MKNKEITTEDTEYTERTEEGRKEVTNYSSSALLLSYSVLSVSSVVILLP